MSNENRVQRWRKIKKPVYVIFLILFLGLFSISTFGCFLQFFDRSDIWIGILPLSQFTILLSAWGMALAISILYLIEKHFLGSSKK